MTDASIQKYCKARLFSEVGKKTPVAVRFSTVGKWSSAVMGASIYGFGWNSVMHYTCNYLPFGGLRCLDWSSGETHTQETTVIL